MALWSQGKARGYRLRRAVGRGSSYKSLVSFFILSSFTYVFNVPTFKEVLYKIVPTGQKRWWKVSKKKRNKLSPNTYEKEKTRTKGTNPSTLAEAEGQKCKVILGYIVVQAKIHTSG